LYVLPAMFMFLAHEYIISLLGHCVIYNIPCFFSLNAESVVFVI
jgi:hypothetical protein